MKNLILLFLFAFLLTGCDLFGEDDPAPARLYVGNQGNFSDENGSVTRYNPETGQAAQDVFAPLNALVQSVALHEGKGYLMLNFATFNAGRIDVFDPETNTRTAQITGVTTPRYFAATGTKGYVSNLYDNTVTILDLAANTATGTIAVGDGPEGLALANGRLYVANNNYGFSTTVSVIDTNTDTVVQTLSPGCDGPRFVVMDAENELWVFCTGKTVYNDDFSEIIEQTNGQVVVMNPNTGAVVHRFPLDAQFGGFAAGQDVFYSAQAREVYAIVGASVLRFDTAANALAATISTPSADLSAVAYDAAERRLYLAHTPAYDVAGTVTIHARDGQQLGSFAAGVAPAAIALREE